jgi:APA family basic amino acid/polyamine antiporter
MSLTPTVEAASLRPVFGLSTATAIVVGTMLGTGIFLVPGSIARSAGSPELVLLAWVVGGLLALFGAISYAELGAALPAAGGEYAFLRRAYGDRVAFLFGWSHALLIRPCSGATLAAGLVSFAVFLAPSLQAPAWSAQLWLGGATTVTLQWGQLLGVAVLLAAALVNVLGVRLGGGVQVVLTGIKVAVLGLFVCAAFVATPSGASTAAVDAPVASASAAGFIAAVVGTLWAFDGWNNLTLAGSEVVAPDRTIPRALVGGVLLVMGTYFLVNLACVRWLPFSTLASSAAPVSAVTALVAGPGSSAWLTTAMIVSALGSLNSDTLTGARVPFALARDGAFFRFAGRVHPRFETPSGALGLQALVAAALVLSGGFEDLYSLFVFGQWIFFGLTASAVLVLRRREPGLERPFRAWGYPVVPILFLVLTAGIWVERPVRSSLGLGLILLGLPLRRWLLRSQS